MTLMTPAEELTHPRIDMPGTSRADDFERLPNFMERWFRGPDKRPRPRYTLFARS
jgi:hypothetical protein